MFVRIDPIYRHEAVWYLGMTSNLIDVNDKLNKAIGRLSYSLRPTVYSLTLAKRSLTETLHLSHKLDSHNVSSECSRVSQTIPITCAGLLEIGVDSSHSTWESMSFSSWHRKLVCWFNQSVRFIHRSAKEFLDLDSRGGLLLRSYKTFPKATNLLQSALSLVQMTLCNLEDGQAFEHYMRHYTGRLMRCAREALPSSRWSRDEIFVSMELLRYFDSSIQEIYQQKNKPLDSEHWCQSWCDALGSEIYERRPLGIAVRPFPLRYSPSDLQGLAAFYKIEWFLLEELRERSLSKEKASQLAFCANINESFRRHILLFNQLNWGMGSGIRSKGAVEILMRLVQLGADPSTGLSTSIWEQTLMTIYGTKLAELPLDPYEADAFDALVSQVSEIFCKNGADPPQIISIQVIGPSLHFKNSGLACFEIDTSCLSILHAPSMLVTTGKAQSTDQSKGLDSLRRPLRLWFYKRSNTIEPTDATSTSINSETDCPSIGSDDAKDLNTPRLPSNEKFHSLKQHSRENGTLPIAQKQIESKTESFSSREILLKRRSSSVDGEGLGELSLSEAQESYFNSFLQQILDNQRNPHARETAFRRLDEWLSG